MEAGLTLAEIGPMSAGELDDFCEAQLNREKREWDRICYMTAHLLNASRAKGQKAIKASDLLGRPMLSEKKKAEPMSREQIEKDKKILRQTGTAPRRP